MRGKDLTSSSEGIVKTMLHNLQKCFSWVKYIKEEEELEEGRLKNIKAFKAVAGALERSIKHIKGFRKQELKLASDLSSKAL